VTNQHFAATQQLTHQLQALQLAVKRHDLEMGPAGPVVAAQRGVHELLERVEAAGGSLLGVGSSHQVPGAQASTHHDALAGTLQGSAVINPGQHEELPVSSSVQTDMGDTIAPQAVSHALGASMPAREGAQAVGERPPVCSPCRSPVTTNVLYPGVRVGQSLSDQSLGSTPRLASEYFGSPARCNPYADGVMPSSTQPEVYMHTMCSRDDNEPAQRSTGGGHTPTSAGRLATDRLARDALDMGCIAVQVDVETTAATSSQPVGAQLGASSPDLDALSLNADGGIADNEFELFTPYIGKRASLSRGPSLEPTIGPTCEETPSVTEGAACVCVCNREVGSQVRGAKKSEAELSSPPAIPVHPMDNVTQLCIQRPVPLEGEPLLGGDADIIHEDVAIDLQHNGMNMRGTRIAFPCSSICRRCRCMRCPRVYEVLNSVFESESLFFLKRCTHMGRLHCLNVM
jgi:hypothetical protein